MRQPHSHRASLEAENELRHFLKLARPQWSLPRTSGKDDIARVIGKLRAIGVLDTAQLVDRIDRNTINDDLTDAGEVRFSREAVESIRRQIPFIRALENADVPHVRQTGPFAPVPQMLSSKRLVTSYRPGLGTTSSSAAGSRRPLKGRSPAGLSMSHSDGFLDNRSSFGSMASSDGFSELGRVGRLPRLRGGNQTKRRCRRPATAAGILDFDHAREVVVEECVSGVGSRAEASTAVPAETPTAAQTRPPRPQIALRWEDDDAGSPSGNSTPASLTSPNRGAGFTGFAATPTFGFNAGDYAMTPVGRSARSPSPMLPLGKGQPGQSPNMLVAPPPVAPSLSPSGRSDPELSDIVVKPKTSKVRRSSGSREARWTCARVKSPQQQGEEMLLEQRALDDRANLVRLVCGAAPHGHLSTAGDISMRGHMAKNIRNRLREEALRDSVEGYSVQEQCMNIRKHLASMAERRKQLSGFRTRLQTVTDGEEAAEKHHHPPTYVDLGIPDKLHMRPLRHFGPQQGAVVSTTPRPSVCLKVVGRRSSLSECTACLFGEAVKYRFPVASRRESPPDSRGRSKTGNSSSPPPSSSTASRPVRSSTTPLPNEARSPGLTPSTPGEGARVLRSLTPGSPGDRALPSSSSSRLLASPGGTMTRVHSANGPLPTSSRSDKRLASPKAPSVGQGGTASPMKE